MIFQIKTKLSLLLEGTLIWSKTKRLRSSINFSIQNRYRTTYPKRSSQRQSELDLSKYLRGRNLIIKTRQICQMPNSALKMKSNGNCRNRKQKFSSFRNTNCRWLLQPLRKLDYMPKSAEGCGKGKLCMLFAEGNTIQGRKRIHDWIKSSLAKNMADVAIESL